MTGRAPPAPHLLLAALCVGLGAATVGRVGWAVAAGGVGLGALAMAAPLRLRLPLLAAAAAAAGWWAGSARLDALDRSPLSAQAGRAAPARVVITGPARRGRYGLRLPARILELAGRRASEPVLLRLPVGRSPPQGAILETVGTLSRPRRSAGGFDERTWLQRHGVHLVLRADRWRLVGRRGGLGGMADRLRRFVESGAAAGLQGERRAVVLGVVLGEDEGLSEELRQRFRASGLYHLLAVSGQNVALVAGGVLLLSWLAGLPRLLGQVAALAAIAAYVLAVGPQPSVVRAGVAGALASLAWICARQRDRWWFLLLGALSLLAWNPYTLLDPGFQLSFVAVAAIFLLVPSLMRLLEGYPLPRRAAAVVAVSAVCGLATAPVLLAQFGRVPAYSVAANALAAPAVPLLLGLSLAAAALQPLDPGAAAGLAFGAGWCAAWLTLAAETVARLPQAELGPNEALALAAVGTAAALARRGGRRWRWAGAALCLAALAWAGRSWVAPSPAWAPPEGLRATFLDVGQGDSALLETPQGAVLVDGGPPEADVAGALRRRGITALSLLVLTHPQRDHVGGAEEVARRLPPAAVLYPGLAVTSPDEHRALAAARRRGARVEVARAGAEYRLGRLRLRVLWPEGPGAPGDDPNRGAVVLLASYGRTDLLLTADAESDVIGSLPLPPVEVLKVAHHGSADPGLPALLRRLRPAAAVVSVGRENEYGHPSPSTLQALAALPGLRLYRTDEDGDVTVESDGRALLVRAER